jgi:hypothetical protein
MRSDARTDGRTFLSHSHALSTNSPPFCKPTRSAAFICSPPLSFPLCVCSFDSIGLRCARTFAVVVVLSSIPLALSLYLCGVCCFVTTLPLSLSLSLSLSLWLWLSVLLQCRFSYRLSVCLFAKRRGASARAPCAAAAAPAPAPVPVRVRV